MSVNNGPVNIDELSKRFDPNNFDCLKKACEAEKSQSASMNRQVQNAILVAIAKKLREAQTTLVQTQKDLEERTVEVDSFETENKDFAAENERLAEENKTLAEENKTLASEIENLKIEVEDLKKQAESFNNNVVNRSLQQSPNVTKEADGSVTKEADDKDQKKADAKAASDKLVKIPSSSSTPKRGASQKTLQKEVRVAFENLCKLFPDDAFLKSKAPDINGTSVEKFNQAIDEIKDYMTKLLKNWLKTELKSNKEARGSNVVRVRVPNGSVPKGKKKKKK